MGASAKPSYTPIPEIPKIRSELRAGFNTGRLRPIEYRKKQLLALGYMLEDNVKRFQDVLKIDLGRSPLETSLFDINGCIREVALCLRRVDKWSRTERAPFDLTTFALNPKLRKEPKGVVLILGPFNFPLWCIFSPLAGAIAAGCAAVIKPSAQTPATGALIAELFNQYMDRDLYRCVLGTTPETTELLSLQWDHICVTGGPTVGRAVAEAAAKFVTPVTLELGGKSPVIIDRSCDLPLTCRRLLWAKTSNAGQICTGPDYVLVARDFQKTFVEALQTEYHKFYPAGPKNSDSFTRIVGPSQFERIKKLLDATKGTIVVGGDTDARDKYIAPTIVKDVKPDDSLMSEELFAPVLPIVPVADLDAAIAFINSRDHPLALYLFTTDAEVKSKVLSSTLSGSVGINDCLLQVQADGLPFGGVGPSGYGSHTGKFGFDTFTHLRPYIDSPWFIDWIMKFRFPPYSDKKLRNINAAMLTKLPSRDGYGTASRGDALVVLFALIIALGLTVLGFMQGELETGAPPIISDLWCLPCTPKPTLMC